MSLPEKDVLNRTRSYFVDQMAVCCGGRIAEKALTGDISTGAAQDIAQATELARNMVCSYGMSDRFGFQSFKEPSRWTGEPQPPAFSEETARAIDEEVSRLVGEAYARAESIIGENHAALGRIAAALLEKETVDGRDVEALLREPTEGADAAPPAEEVEGQCK